MNALTHTSSRPQRYTFVIWTFVSFGFLAPLGVTANSNAWKDSLPLSKKSNGVENTNRTVSGNQLSGGEVIWVEDQIHSESNHADSMESSALGPNSSSLGNSAEWGYFNDVIGGAAIGKSFNCSSWLNSSLGGSHDITYIGNGAHQWNLGHNNAHGRWATAWGYRINADSFLSTAFGQYNIGGVDIANHGDRTWLLGDPLLEVGLGLTDSSRANALTILKDGRIALGAHSALPSIAVETVQVQGPILIQDYADIATASPSAGAIRYDAAAMDFMAAVSVDSQGVATWKSLTVSEDARIADFQIQEWTEAYAWGDHNAVGYLKSDGDGEVALNDHRISGLHAGAVAMPSISFDGDLDTGFYAPAADVFALVTGGTDRLTVDANGHVGIGTGLAVLTEQLELGGAVVLANTETETEGAIRYNSNDPADKFFEGFDGSEWKRLDLNPADLLASDALTLDGNILTLHYADAVTTDTVDLSTIVSSGTKLTAPSDENTDVVTVVDVSTVNINANVGIGTGSAVLTEQLELAGAIVVGDTTGTKLGTIRYRTDEFEGYVADVDGLGTPGWKSLTHGDNADVDPENEMNQTLMLNGTVLELTDGKGTLSADLKNLVPDSATSLVSPDDSVSSAVAVTSLGTVIVEAPVGQTALQVAGDVKIEGNLEIVSLTRQGDVFMGQFGRSGDDYEGSTAP
jgi:hypothetical protein